jgi:hypothetical protein
MENYRIEAGQAAPHHAQACRALNCQWMGGQAPRQGRRCPLPSMVTRSCPPEIVPVATLHIPAIFYPCINTAFLAFRCFANTSLLPRVEGTRTGFPLNIL